ncbi:MAG: hypothetical protein Q7S68_03450 [Deltaproteobacteria bacterium]|nr:hypothetical protein [Deltaproteobacteria bacterium]
MKKVWLAVFLFFPLTTFAWNETTHRILALESLRNVAPSWELDKKIVVTPFSQFLASFSKTEPTVQTREDFARWLQINPESPFDQPVFLETVGGVTTPLEILYLHSPSADDGRDKELSYHQLTQFWFGGMHKASSQAFRHIEKVPFDPLHPLNTFGFPLGTVGEASERAEIYFQLAVRAKKIGEEYWAWNFLGIGLHYIQDLQQPYHTMQLSLPLLLKGGFSIQKIAKEISDSHHAFEDKVMEEMETPAKRHWILALRGEETFDSSLFPPDKEKIRNLAKLIRNFANKSAYDTVRTPDPVDQIVLENFIFQGKAIRTVVKTFKEE